MDFISERAFHKWSVHSLPTVSKTYKTEIFIYVMPFTYGLTHTTRVGVVFATLSVTLERFFAIVFPFKNVDEVKKWLIPSTVVFTVIYNIPKFFEVKYFKNSNIMHKPILAC